MTTPWTRSSRPRRTSPRRRQPCTKQAVILRYTRVNSPISGRIGKSSVTQGALVTANQAAPLATVQQLDPMYVDVTQSSAELLELRKQLAASNVEDARDQPVKILLEDGTPYGHDGKLAFSEVTVDPTTGSYGIRVVVPNPENILLPGMYVRAIVGSTVREGALLVPQQAIVRDSKGDPTAMVVGKDDKIEVREVQVSRAIGDKWLVEGGLAAGERVVVEGLQKIRPGVTVQAVEAGAQPPAAAASAAAISRVRHGTLLHRPSDLRLGHRDHHHAGGRPCHHAAADLHVPEHRAAVGDDQRQLSGRVGQGGRGLGDADHRAEHEGPRRPDLHVRDQRGIGPAQRSP